MEQKDERCRFKLGDKITGAGLLRIKYGGIVPRKAKYKQGNEVRVQYGGPVCNISMRRQAQTEQTAWRPASRDGYW